MHTKHFYFMKGWAYARTHTICAWGSCDSWQRKMFKMGYQSSMLYLEGEVLLEGFDTAEEYKRHLIKQTIKD